ncbi:MAG: glycoside hydrolase family 3 protein [Thermoleophilia bacterium]|nr:glycoside hydrolase family 3 protein [Thermoleophilia bacterium]
MLALAAVLASLAPGAADGELARMTAYDKAALLVVSGQPAPRGVGGVFVRRWDRNRPRPPGALVFADQEGGAVRGFPHLPPARPAAAYRSAGEARAAGRATGRALRRAGVHVDLAPVLDAPTGPLGSRHFRDARFGWAFADGLASTGVAACAKHFPGLGTARLSTDDHPHVRARLERAELAAFRGAVARGVPCVMTSHAFYPSLGRFRASLEARTYRQLRSYGFRGVAITDSLSIVREPPAYWPRRAVHAGADLLLFTSPEHARRAIRSLLPLARRGDLDRHVRRVLAFRRAYGRR